MPEAVHPLQCLTLKAVLTRDLTTLNRQSLQHVSPMLDMGCLHCSASLIRGRPTTCYLPGSALAEHALLACIIGPKLDAKLEHL